MDDKLRGTIEMSLAMVILGTIGWFVVLSGRPVADVVFWRCAFGATTLLVVSAASGSLHAALSVRVLVLSAIGGVAIVVNWVLLFAAYSHASISIATAVYNTQPFMLIAFGAVVFSERLTAAKLTWLGLAFAGLLLVVQVKPEADYVGEDYVTGIVLALGAAFFWAVAAIATKSLRGTPPHLIALIQVVIGTFMLAPFADLSHPPASAESWAMLATVGIVHTGLVYILMYAAIQRLPTDLQGSLSFVYPVVAILVDVVALGNSLHASQSVGAAAILFAAAAMNRGWSPWSRRASPQPP